jgi:hypothetical protein
MAIAHNVLGRLVRFNSARDKSGEGWRVSGGQRDSQRQRTSIGRVLIGALLRGIGFLRWTDIEQERFPLLSRTGLQSPRPVPPSTFCEDARLPPAGRFSI